MSLRRLAESELLVLMTVAELGDEAYGARVRQVLTDRMHRTYSVGAVHTTLQRLEDKGLLKSSFGDPAPVRGGRARRHFRLSKEGRALVKVEVEARQQLWSDFIPIS